MPDLDRIYRERMRVRRAEVIQSRLDAIISSLGQMKQFTEVHVSSQNNCDWQPRIPSERVKQFVREVYQQERESLEAELEALYPSPVEEVRDDSQH